MSERSTELELIPRGAPIDLDPYLASEDAPWTDAFQLDLSIDPARLHSLVDHVPNTEYVRWLDRAAELHADALGLTRGHLLERGIMWFVARHEIDYRAEARGGDALVVATRVRGMERARSWRDYAIVRPDDGALVCRAATLWVLVSLQTRRPVRIPADMRARFEPTGATGTDDREAPCTSP